MKKVALLQLLRKNYPQYDKDALFARILCGEVLVDGVRLRDPRQMVSADARVAFTPDSFVSRGGVKLDSALAAWHISVAGKVFLDAGSSTGGFTDALLQRGAANVHAVDVGYNQIAYRLRNDERVLLHERVNILDIQQLDPLPDAGVADLSFRSVVPVISHILDLVRERWVIALVKPQFEVLKDTADFDGVVREKTLLKDTLFRVVDELSQLGIRVEKTLPSPIKGRKGNQEFLFLLKRAADAEQHETAGVKAELEGWLI